MKVEFYCPRWGSEELPFEIFLKKVADTGYDGVEMSLPLEEKERVYLVDMMREHKLKFIAQHWETIDADFSLHKKNFEQRLMNLASGKPVFINSQTGKDYYSEAQNMELINLATEVSSRTGIPILHETHRGKWSFAAHITYAYLKKHPSIRLTLDASHWCNVAESFLQDQEEAMQLAIEHTDHIHSRVGFSEGPQITDPRAPEWKDALDTHISWWDKVMEAKRAQGTNVMTVTPEFGAPPYLTLIPFTRQPLVSQWEVNAFMLDLLKKRYN